jgi:predicted nucleotidyltransferase
MRFEAALKTLTEHEVEFVIIGGLAAAFHGSARLTYDLDVCYSRTSSNLKKLSAALAPFHPRPRGFPPGLPFVWDETTLRNASIFTLQTDIGEIDLLAEVAGVGSFREAREQSIAVEAFGLHVLTLDLPALIRAKRAAGREKDLAALPELEGILEADE